MSQRTCVGRGRIEENFSWSLLRIFAHIPGQKSATLSHKVQTTDSGDILGDMLGKFRCRSLQRSENKRFKQATAEIGLACRPWQALQGSQEVT